MYIPKAQAFFPSNITKLKTSQYCPVSLSFEFSIATIWPIARRSGKVLAFSQDLQPNKASNCYVLKTCLLSPSNLQKSAQNFLLYIFLLLFVRLSRSSPSFSPSPPHFSTHQNAFRLLEHPQIAPHTSVSFFQKPCRSLATPFYPAPTVCRHCSILLIIFSRQFSWTTQHTPANTKQSMQPMQ